MVEPKLNRQAIGCETERDYVELMKRRFEGHGLLCDLMIMLQAATGRVRGCRCVAAPLQQADGLIVMRWSCRPRSASAPRAFDPFVDFQTRRVK